MPSPDLASECQSRAPILLAMLPATAGTIASACGFAALLALIEARGGTSMYIPARLDDAHRTRLAGIVGPDHARTLMARYGGSYMTVPTPKSVLACLNRLRVVELSTAGLPRSKIATQLGITTRAVTQIKAAAQWKLGAGQVRGARQSSESLQPKE